MFVRIVGNKADKESSIFESIARAMVDRNLAGKFIFVIVSVIGTSVFQKIVLVNVAEIGFC